LLYNDDPRTQDEWRAFLLYATLLARSNKHQEAKERYAWAISACPFARENRLFRAGLAAQSLALGRARQAPFVGEAVERDIGNVIDFQTAVAARRRDAEKLYNALKRNLPAHLVELRDEIARVHGLAPGSRRHTPSWITRNVNDALVLAIAA
jgi:hypothetical protein